MLESYGIVLEEAVGGAGIEGDAATVLARIRDAPSGADELVRATGLHASAVAVALSELELGGHVVEAAGRYRAVR